MFGISKTHLGVMAFALLAFVLVAIIQQHVTPVPVVGRYLPR